MSSAFSKSQYTQQVSVLHNMERLISTSEAAQILDMSQKVAREFLIQHGLQPISLGPGRGRGLRWLASAVENLILTIHAEAQQTGSIMLKRSSSEKSKEIESQRKPLRVADMSIDELYSLLTQ